MKIAASVTKAEARKVEKMAHRCLRLLSKKDYYLNFDYKEAKTRISYYMHVFRRRDGRSRAGKNHMAINLSNWQIGNGKNYWTEYASFNNDPTIGQIGCTDDDDKLFILVAHEVAHFVQCTYIPSMKTARHVRALDTKSHGERFKYVYRILRRDLVNPSINDKWKALRNVA